MRFWDVTQEIDRLRGDMDRLFAQAVAGLGLPRAANGTERVVLRPVMTADEDEDAYRLAIDLPGVRPEGLDAELHDRSLRIRAVRDERRSYERLLPLPEDVDAERVSADLRDGVLWVTLPKREEVKPRKVAIGAGDQAAIAGESREQVTAGAAT